MIPIRNGLLRLLKAVSEAAKSYSAVLFLFLHIRVVQKYRLLTYQIKNANIQHYSVKLLESRRKISKLEVENALENS